jgi:hypothetical protein
VHRNRLFKFLRAHFLPLLFMPAGKLWKPRYQCDAFQQCRLVGVQLQGAFIERQGFLGSPQIKKRLPIELRIRKSDSPF